jgi:hypothetical protein
MESPRYSIGRNADDIVDWLRAWTIQFDKQSRPIPGAGTGMTREAYVRARVLLSYLNKLQQRWKPALDPLEKLPQGTDRLHIANVRLMAALNTECTGPDWWNEVELQINRLLGIKPI